MIKQIAILLISCCVTLSGCKDYLEEVDPNRVTADNYFTTPAGLKDAVDGTYSTMRDWIGLEEHYTFTVFGTDTYTEGSDESSSWQSKQFNRYSSDLNPLSDRISVLWEVCYQGINNANTAINRGTGIEMDQTEKNDLLAQARFLRAYYYFWLVRTYGGVPIKLNETTSVELNFSRPEAVEVLDVIIQDLEFAAENLKDTQEDFGRPTSWAAKTFLSLAYLTRAKGNNDFQASLDHAVDVINNGPYRLLPDYEDLWDLENQMNDEVIWSVQFTSIEADNGGDGNRGHLFFLMEYDLGIYNMQRDVENGRPFKRFKPTDYLLSLFAENDPRFDATFKTVWYCNSEERLPSDGSLSIGDTCIYMPRIALSQSEIDSRPYTVINPADYDLRTFPSLRKFDQPDRIDLSERDGSRDHMVFRLAEVYLIAAEAAFKLEGSGLQYLNAVRNRANQPDLESINIEVILDERARELVGEGKRWFDLVRTGTLVDRVRAYNPINASDNIQDHHVLRPIPQSEIDIINSSSFQQNLGY